MDHSTTTPDATPDTAEAFAKIVASSSAPVLRQLAKKINGMATELEVQERLQAPARPFQQAFSDLEGTICDSEGLIYATQLLVEDGYVTLPIEDLHQAAARQATLVVLYELKTKLKLAVDQAAAVHQAWVGERRSG